MLNFVMLSVIMLNDVFFQKFIQKLNANETDLEKKLSGPIHVLQRK
jgi:hypothetical protein